LKTLNLKFLACECETSGSGTSTGEALGVGGWLRFGDVILITPARRSQTKPDGCPRIFGATWGRLRKPKNSSRAMGV